MQFVALWSEDDAACACGHFSKVCYSTLTFVHRRAHRSRKKDVLFFFFGINSFFYSGSSFYDSLHLPATSDYRLNPERNKVPFQSYERGVFKWLICAPSGFFCFVFTTE